jgi:DUF1009 family protein
MPLNSDRAFSLNSLTFPKPARLGLIAGSSEYPILVAKEAIASGTEVIAIGFPEITSPEIEKVIPSIHWIPFGQFEPVVRTIVGAGIKEAMFAGKIPQTVIYKSKTFDKTAQGLLSKLSNQQTDSLIGAAANAFAMFGVTFIDARTFLENHLAENGAMTQRQPTESELKDIEFGFKMAKHVAAEDIGQTVIVKQRAVLAVESIEGTDEAIHRAAKFGGEGIVIVKVSKPKQNFRFDVPIIGIDTLDIMKEVKSNLLAIESEKTIIMQKSQVLQKANETGICIYGVKTN